MRRVMLVGACLSGLLPFQVWGQVITNGTPSVTATTFTANGTLTVPWNVNAYRVSGCANGGPGAGGGASSGGGAGGAGQCVDNIVYPVTPGSTITVTVPSSPAGGAAGGTGSDAASTTVAGGTFGTLTLYPGQHGLAGSGTTGGAGGAGGGAQTGGTCAGAGGAAATAGGNGSNMASYMFCGSGGGGGGGSAAAGAVGGKIAVGFYNVLGSIATAAPGGNASGGGGGTTIFGNGQPGVAASTSCSASPTWVGYGGGGCGAGSTGSGGPGGPAFVTLVPVG